MSSKKHRFPKKRGGPCKKGHESEGNGVNLYYSCNSYCVICRSINDKERRSRGKMEIVDKDEYVYLFRAHGNWYKIGFTTSPHHRLSALKPGCPEYTGVEWFQVPDATRIEKELHRKFIEYRRDYEWFDLWPREIKTAKDFIAKNGGVQVHTIGE